MSKHNSILFTEKQYQGLNKHSLVRRMLLSVFCFVAYYWSENPKPVDVSFIRIGEYPGDVRYGELFFVLGIAVMVLSVILLFIPHMKTILHANKLEIKGRFSNKSVIINVVAIEQVRKIVLRPSIFNRPVFNLYGKGKIRFYTHGNESIELKTSDGTIYRIGSQKTDELCRQLKSLISAQNNG